MFTSAYRERVREHILRVAREDQRILGGAVVGSDAVGGSDRWSDLDLTFGLTDGSPATQILDDWAADLDRTFGAVRLFDLRDRETSYRVFLLPGLLQVDLSVTPGFVADNGPRFKLLFGTATRKQHSPPRPPRDALGCGIHHAVRARFCIERGRLWQAEYWIGGVRDEALSLACLRRGLPPDHGRGVDRLPPEVLTAAAAAMVHGVDRSNLLRALGHAVELLLSEGTQVPDLTNRLAGPLHELTRDIGP
ncbi:MAG: nucleotidyltransferase domain-containing protein [Thermoplasmata archaeon]